MIGVLGAAAIAGCGGDLVDSGDATLYPEGTPLWKQLPDKPAGPAPPAVDGRARSFALQRVAAGFRQPNQVVFRPGDDRRFVVEQGGTVQTGGVAKPWLDLTDLTAADGERGLLSLAFAPDGATAYVLFTTRRGDTRVLAVPVTREGRADRAGAREILALRQPYENHNGGTLLVDERGRIVLGLGDGGSAFDPGQRAQDRREKLGKVLRYDPSAPRDGWETVATGLRNPFRMSFDRDSGMLWIGDVGQDRVEEVDAVFLPEEGAPVPNLGWAAYEGHLPLGRKQLARGTRDLTWPVASYLHRGGHCSVTGGYVYRGRRVAALRGRYVFGDFCRGTVWSLRAAAAESGDRADLRREAARLPGLVSFGEDARGELYAVSIQGSVHRLIPDHGGRG